MPTEQAYPKFWMSTPNLGLRLQANPQNCKETLEYWIAQTKKGRAVGGCYAGVRAERSRKRSILDAPRQRSGRAGQPTAA
jgi:hypothetical protein